jgi:5-methylcytosine-specific restriction endonuclease McrA
MLWLFSGGRSDEKLHRGIWVFNGVFSLIDAWKETSNTRQVYKFLLELTESNDYETDVSRSQTTPEHNRIIPPQVKLTVWKRDKGKCVICGKSENLHFDHIIPYSKGGSSLVAENIQLLCAQHNLEKRDRIE